MKKKKSTTKTDLILDILNKRWENYLALVRSCRREATDEAVHEFRVASRRLLSIVELLRGIKPDPDLYKLRSTLKSQLDQLDELSDTQFMLVDVGEIVHEFPTAMPFLSHLRKQEKKLSERAEAQIRMLEPAAHKKRFQSILKNQTSYLSANQVSNPILQDVVDAAYALVLIRFRLVNHKETSTIHLLRIAFRKFRYLVEIIHPVLRGYPREHLALMRDYQGLMGAIQDNETLQFSLHEYSENKKDFNPKPIQSYLEGQHAELVSAYLRDMEKIRVFWRSSKSASFPWTKKRIVSDGQDTSLMLERGESVPVSNQIA